MRIEQLTKEGVKKAKAEGCLYRSGKVTVNGEQIALQQGQMLVIEDAEELRLVDTSWDRRGFGIIKIGPCSVVLTGEGDARTLDAYRLIS